MIANEVLRNQDKPHPSAWPVVVRGDHIHMEASGTVPQTQPRNKSEMELPPGGCREISATQETVGVPVTFPGASYPEGLGQMTAGCCDRKLSKAEIPAGGCASWDVLDSGDGHDLGRRT